MNQGRRNLFGDNNTFFNQWLRQPSRTSNVNLQKRSAQIVMFIPYTLMKLSTSKQESRKSLHHSSVKALITAGEVFAEEMYIFSGDFPAHAADVHWDVS